MPRIFRNLSGNRWSYFHIEWWYLALYCPLFGVSVNIHPNRIRQVFGLDKGEWKIGQRLYSKKGK